MSTELVQAPFAGNASIFLSGPAGSGKTTLAVQRLLFLLEHGVPAEQILVLVPQRTLATPYYEALRSPEAPAGGSVDVATMGGLARRTLELFWPLVAEPAGFAQPNQRPRFLTLETAQYTMDRVLEPFVTAGAFDGITISRARLASQIIDNLNKSAAVGFPVQEIAARLRQSWSGESARLLIYDQVQAVARAFRGDCLAQNLLDWSLQIQTFWQHLLPLRELRRYLLSGYRHLIVDNCEEDIPAAHDLLRIWIPLCESALVIYDTGGGHRVFLGADRDGALELSSLCRDRMVLTDTHVMSAEVSALGLELSGLSNDRHQDRLIAAEGALELPDGLRFHPQMVDWVADEISQLVLGEGRIPGEIAILAPYVSDSLRFTLSEKLSQFNIPVRTHRPSRQLREEPAIRCLLTLAKLAHPDWCRPPHVTDVAHALALSIKDLDPIRAQLLASIVYRTKDDRPTLSPFYLIGPVMQQRITYLLGGRYDTLQHWIRSYVESPAGPQRLGTFVGRLFGELLSKVGFGFHSDLDAGQATANLIESVEKFRQAVPDLKGGQSERDASLEYVDLVERGVVAAQYVSRWQDTTGDAVLLVPAYTFLMRNRPVDVQFWLDAGSRGWSERIYQPLTHPYVLRRDWPEGQPWGDEDEVRVREETYSRLVLGLSRRCREKVYLAYSELNERGYEQQGRLLQAVQRLLRDLAVGRGP